MAAKSDATDWRDGKTLPECLSHLRMSDHMTDVTFTFADGSEVRGHRLLLAARSEVFEAMFYGPVKDTSDKVHIVDIAPYIFEMLIQYIYTDTVTVKLEGKNVLSCLYAAEKYNISGLVQLCSRFLERAMGPDNVCKILHESTMYNMVDLSDTCYYYIATNSNEVFKSDDFNRLPLSLLIYVLCHEDMASPEIDVFNALLMWAKFQCTGDNDGTPSTIRKRIGDALYQIRFPLIPLTEFTSIVVASGILTDKETKSLIKYLTRTSKKKDSVRGFLTKTRQGRGYLVNISPPEMKLVHSTTVTCIPIRIHADNSLCLKELLMFDSLDIRSVSKYINGLEVDHNITNKTKLMKEKKMLVFNPPLAMQSREECLHLYLEPGEYQANDLFRQNFDCDGVSGHVITTGVVCGVRLVANVSRPNAHDLAWHTHRR